MEVPEGTVQGGQYNISPNFTSHGRGLGNSSFSSRPDRDSASSSSGSIAAFDGVYTPEELSRARSSNARNAGPFNPSIPLFFKHGIQYRPDDPSCDRRTVMIENVPGVITPVRLLRNVRGGQLSSALLVAEFTKTGTYAAQIKFKEAANAARFVKHCHEQRPLHFVVTCTGPLHKARVYLVNTATYPDFEDPKEPERSRVLVIPRSATYLKDDELGQHVQNVVDFLYADKLGFRFESIIEIGVNLLGDLRIEFNTIRAAATSMKLLTNNRNLMWKGVIYGVDPCSKAFGNIFSEDRYWIDYSKNSKTFKAASSPLLAVQSTSSTSGSQTVTPAPADREVQVAASTSSTSGSQPVTPASADTAVQVADNEPNVIHLNNTGRVENDGIDEAGKISASCTSPALIASVSLVASAATGPTSADAGLMPKLSTDQN